jgi:hypothetical protein
MECVSRHLSNRSSLSKLEFVVGSRSRNDSQNQNDVAIASSKKMTGNELRNAPIAGVVLGMSSGSSWLRDSGQVAQLPLNRITLVSCPTLLNNSGQICGADDFDDQPYIVSRCPNERLKSRGSPNVASISNRAMAISRAFRGSPPFWVRLAPSPGSAFDWKSCRPGSDRAQMWWIRKPGQNRAYCLLNR